MRTNRYLHTSEGWYPRVKLIPAKIVKPSFQYKMYDYSPQLCFECILLINVARCIID
jgi:hypothetical protein